VLATDDNYSLMWRPYEFLSSSNRALENSLLTDMIVAFVTCVLRTRHMATQCHTITSQQAPIRSSNMITRRLVYIHVTSDEHSKEVESQISRLVEL